MTSEFEKKPQEIVDMNVGGIFMGRYMLQVSSEWLFFFFGGDIVLVIYNLWAFGGSIVDLEDCIDWTRFLLQFFNNGRASLSCCFFLKRFSPFNKHQNDRFFVFKINPFISAIQYPAKKSLDVISPHVRRRKRRRWIWLCVKG